VLLLTHDDKPARNAVVEDFAVCVFVTDVYHAGKWMFYECLER